MSKSLSISNFSKRGLIAMLIEDYISHDLKSTPDLKQIAKSANELAKTCRLTNSELAKMVKDKRIYVGSHAYFSSNKKGVNFEDYLK